MQTQRYLGINQKLFAQHVFQISRYYLETSIHRYQILHLSRARTSAFQKQIGCIKNATTNALPTLPNSDKAFSTGRANRKAYYH